jgi:ATP-dependent Clp protease ATP-binding subunit ClpA
MGRARIVCGWEGEVFERFTEQAHRVIDLAQQEAERLGHRYMGPEHVLLGVLAEGTSSAARVLRASGLRLEAARAELLELARRGMVPGPRPSDTHRHHPQTAASATLPHPNRPRLGG